jgi:nucleoside phosphorylase
LRVINAGIALAALRSHSFPNIAISCGLAGGLRDRSPTGTAVIPDFVQRPNGQDVRCDPELVQILRESAEALRAAYISEPLLTSDALIRGDARHEWADRGFAAVDMESGLIDAPRIAVVRVILDTAQHELNAAWLRPATLIVHPRAWLELPWLAREAPRCARLAARIIGSAFKTRNAR